MPISKENLTLEDKKQQPQVFLHLRFPERVTSPYFQKLFSSSLMSPFCYIPLPFAKQHANPSAGKHASNPVSGPGVKRRRPPGHAPTHQPEMNLELPSLPAQVTVSTHNCNLPQTSSPSVLTPPVHATPEYSEGWGQLEKPRLPPSPAPQRVGCTLTATTPEQDMLMLGVPSPPTQPYRSAEVPAWPRSGCHLSQGGRSPGLGYLGIKAKGSGNCHIRTSYKSNKRAITFGFSMQAMFVVYTPAELEGNALLKAFSTPLL